LKIIQLLNYQIKWKFIDPQDGEAEHIRLLAAKKFPLLKRKEGRTTIIRRKHGFTVILTANGKEINSMKNKKLII